MIIGTIVPQSAADPVETAKWAQAHPGLESVFAPLGLHAAYSQPLFLAIMAVLAASTAVCAWERSVRAITAWRSRGRVTPTQITRLKVAESLPVSAAEESDPQRALERASDALRGIGLRSTRGTSMLEATSGRWGLAGSPVFHWALVGLLVLIPVGRLTRSEGLMGVVAGTSRVDEAAAYGRLQEGPLHGSFTGYRIAVDSGFPLNLREEGVDRGPAPTVSLSDGETLLARQQVVPNRPLRYGPITIHMNELGTGMAYSLVTSEGVAVSDLALIDVKASDPSGFTTFGATYDNANGDIVADLTITMPPGSSPEGTATAGDGHHMRTVAVGPEGARVDRLVTAGDVVDLGAGLALRVDAVDYYARLSVVDDWSVSWIYALFVLAVGAVSVSVLVPHRVVRVLADTTGERPVLRFVAQHGRRSPEFESIVREALRAPEEGEV